MGESHEIHIAETPSEAPLEELTEAQTAVRLIEERLNRPARGGNYLDRKIAARFVSWRNPKR